MKKTAFFFTSILILTLFFVSTGFSERESIRGVREKRKNIALVIGNAQYKNYPLATPSNNARDMTASLEKLGFEVIRVENVRLRGMKKSVHEFISRLQESGGAGLLYYSGHGVQVEGKNYLIPIDAEIYEELEIKYEAINLDWILEKVESANNYYNIIILDACHHNPFSRKFKNVNKGLATVEARRNLIIAYSASPEHTSTDGNGRNSIYTYFLLRHLKENIPVEQLFKRVRYSVTKATEGEQIPWETSLLTGDFYMAPDSAIATHPEKISSHT